MGSTEDPQRLPARKNPHRTCRTSCTAFVEISKCSSKGSGKKANGSQANLSKSSGQQHETDLDVPSSSPSCQQEPPPKIAATNGNLFSDSKYVEGVLPPRATACLGTSRKRTRKGRRKNELEKDPRQDKANLDSSLNLATNGENLNRTDSCPVAAKCGESDAHLDLQRKAKVRRTCIEDSTRSLEDQTPAKTSVARTLRPPNPTSPSSPCQEPVSSTPKSRKPRQWTSPRLTSTPVGAKNLRRLPSTNDKTTSPKFSRTNGHKDQEISPVKAPSQDIKTQKRVRLRKPRAQLNPAARQQKKNEKKKQNDAPPARARRKKDVTKVERTRPRFELRDSDFHESKHQDPDKTLSSDLSIELSLLEDPKPQNRPPSLQQQEEEEKEEEEEEEELPSFLQQDNQKPSSIREGLCVWCKYRKFPYWPAVVKSVNHKTKKASIVFVDYLSLNEKRIKKGLSVSLRTLKPFDCKEAEQFMDIGKEQYGAMFTWCLALISDYRIRIACGFVGSFIDYFSNYISSPVRNEYPTVSSNLALPSQALLSEQEGVECDSAVQLQEDEQTVQSHVRLLPDRALAARNRANERLVEFIVKKRGAENRLMAVISGQESSKWLQAMHSSSSSVVGVYLEDDKQIDTVYQYLREIYDRTAKCSLVLENTDHIRFVLDVLLPEAIIYAIADVDHLSLEKAEEKFRQGPRPSKRERQEFDMMIEQQKSKSITSNQLL